MNGSDALPGTLPSTPILGVDLGGTKALVGLFDRDGRLRVSRRYASADFDGLLSLLECFLAQACPSPDDPDRPGAACLAVAGPVEEAQARLTHLPWRIDAQEIRARLGLDRVLLVNDFVAAAAGVSTLGTGELRSIQRGVLQPDAPRLVIGAGTGLGAALMLGGRAEHGAGPSFAVLAGEAGHVGFAPRDPLECRLWQWLHARHGYVSVETVVSGPGIERIHRFLREERGIPTEEGLNAVPDSAAAISRAALDPERPDALAGEALDLFAAGFGAIAGDMALASLTRGGVFLAGGIAPQVFDDRRTAAFLRAFACKGSHAGLMSGIPVGVVLAPDLGLRGAATLARGVVVAL